MSITLLGELNLWTFDDNINIKNTDHGAFRYHDKRIDNIYEEGKRSYSQKRGMTYVPTNKKGNKLKDAIKHLEEQLKDNSTIYCQWNDHSILQIMLSNGLLIYIQINVETADIVKCTFDKYLMGKLCDHISDVAITKTHLICMYNDNQITTVYFTKPRRHPFDKISKLEPKLSTSDLFGSNGRRLDKNIQINKPGDLILIWWKSTMNEVYPWSPVVKEHDRANIHLYRLTGTKLDLIYYVRTEFDPLCIKFDIHHENVIHSVEQKVSRKGEVTIEWRTYEVSQQDKLQRIAIISIPLPTHTSCVKFSPNQELLLLCCIDGSVMLYDETKATIINIKAGFIPTLASWHNDGMIFSIGNDRGQFQHFDIALHCIKNQMLNDETSPANILDLSSYFRSQPALVRMEWNKKNQLNSHISYYSYGDSLFLLLFERGPIGVIRVVEGDNLSGDILVRKYLILSQIEQATSLLLRLNWDTHPRICMHSLNQILNYLFKLPLTAEHESFIQNALGSFHVPIRPISQAIEDEYGDEVRDLTRRFFHHLLRYRMFEKAFRLAIDLNDHDLFMDIHFYALVLNDMEMANAAKEKAEQILSRSNSCNSSHSTCSRESCSICSELTSDKGEESYSNESENSTKEDETNSKYPKRYNYKKNSNNHVPPLPILYPSYYDNKTLLPTSLNDDPSSNKSDYSIISTSFNTPSNTLANTNFNDSSSHIQVSNTFFASTSFSTPTYVTRPNLTSISTVNSINRVQPYNKFSEDLMTTSFGNLSLSKQKSSSLDRQHHDEILQLMANKSGTNDTQYTNNLSVEDTVTIIPEENNFISTSFNNSTYEFVLDNVPSSSLIPTLSNVDNNIMSTSFSTITCNTSVSNNSDNNSDSNIKCDNTPFCYSSSIRTNDSSSNVMSQIDTSNSVIQANKLITTPHKTKSNTLFTTNKYSESPTTYDSNIKVFRAEDYMDHHQKINKKQSSSEIPLPPSITSSFTNYLQNLQRKNYSLSQSTLGLMSIDESNQKISSAKVMNITPCILQRQNSASNILQDQCVHSNSKTCRINSDLTYIPYHGSCDSLNVTKQHNNRISTTNALSYSHSAYNLQSRLLENRHIKIGSQISSNIGKEIKTSSNIPPLPIVNTSNSNSKTYSMCPTFLDTPMSTNEKPKVKFSDTVTHILVPGTNQSHRQRRSTVTQLHVTDPKRELAESLPLCLGNEDYLKDFQPLSKDADNEISKESSKSEEGSKIKVVHFGLL
ncbi:WD repeat-containing and planar cell polarity effector protein fritz isoform X1 [Polistes fuscatus]|uniref:WD repeat-containing and planar cell polarity effector protein fritz isoform X1 n=2 Tax=Polistes fuscatus TaxID=30207 RepID=UPI001CA7D309|nr:WD repeat-containing and planar cell polarity effector protein fritz isoform X1 [Polistes fuscatus]